MTMRLVSQTVSPRSVARSIAARTLAVVGAAALIAAGFFAWDTEGRAGLDLGLRSLGIGTEQPTIALALIGLAAIAAVPALVSDWGLPRAVAAFGGALIALIWLAAGPDGSLTAGVVVSLGGVSLLLLSAALATGTAAPAPAPEPPSGHRYLGHTADVAFVAWGRSRAECIVEAVRALVGSFADVPRTVGTRRHDLRLPPPDDAIDLLVDVLDEVIYLLDTEGMMPLGGSLADDEDGGLRGHFELVDARTAVIVGAVPKAITYHQLTFAPTARGWRCRVIVDV